MHENEEISVNLTLGLSIEHMVCSRISKISQKEGLETASILQMFTQF